MKPFGSATVSVASVGVPPTESLLRRTSPMGEQDYDFAKCLSENSNSVRGAHAPPRAAVGAPADRLWPPWEKHAVFSSFHAFSLIFHTGPETEAVGLDGRRPAGLDFYVPINDQAVVYYGQGLLMTNNLRLSDPVRRLVSSSELPVA
jgi:hypothetical protein